MPKAAAGVDIDGQPVAFGSPVKRPVLPPTQGQFGHCQQQHTDKTSCQAPAVRFRLSRQFGTVDGSGDGGAQAVVAAQPFRCEPVIDGAHSAAARSSLDSTWAPWMMLQMA